MLYSKAENLHIANYVTVNYIKLLSEGLLQNKKENKVKNKFNSRL